MNIVSSADSGFFHCAVELAKTVRKHYGKQLILYDVGLSDEQRGSIDATVITIQVTNSFRGHAKVGRDSFVQATHKPLCVIDYFRRYSDPILFVDADCYFTSRVEENGFDVGVTLRSGGKDVTNHFNGLINTGVIFFNMYPAELLQMWMDECAKPETTDQKAMCDILSESIDWQHYNKVYDWRGLKVKVFGTDEYNDYHLRGGKILHFKGRRHEKGIYERLIDGHAAGKDIYAMYNELTGRKSLLRRWFDNLLH
jgi:hypothetical protein